MTRQSQSQFNDYIENSKQEMMKNKLLFIAVFWSIWGQAQNWEPIHLNWGPHFYEAENSEPTKAIKTVAYFESPNPTYIFNPEYTSCVFCELPSPICESGGLPESDTLFLRIPSIVGDSLRIIEGLHWFYGADIAFDPHAQLNDTWEVEMGTELITGEVVETNFESVLGSMDSTKTLQFSNGNSCTISKHHGIIAIQSGTTPSYHLAGIPETQEGESFPSMRDFYGFEVGDVFMFRTYSWGAGGDSWKNNNSGRMRVEIIDVIDYPDSIRITYDLARTNTLDQGAGPIETQGFYSGLEKTIYLQVRSMKGIVPGTFVSNLDSLNSLGALTISDFLSFEPNQYGWRAKAIEHYGRKGLKFGWSNACFIAQDGSLENSCNEGEAYQANPVLWQITNSELNYNGFEFSDTLQQSQLQEYCWELTIDFEFVSGLGMTSFRNEAGLAGGGHYMIGYRKGEETRGEVPSVGELLSANDVLNNQIEIYPNPTRGKLNINGLQQVNRFEVYSLDGRLLTSEEVQLISDEALLDLSHLPSGTYLLRTSSEVGRVQRIIVKE